MNAKLSALAFTIFLSASIFGSAASVSVTSTSDNEVFNITYKAEEKGNVKVTILDNQNEVVFTETISNIASFSRPYNFQSMKQGEYTIVVEGKGGKQSEKIVYGKNAVASFVRVAAMKNESNKYVLYVHNNGTETIRLSIHGDGNVIHEQSLDVTGYSGLVYDLKKVKAGKITFYVTTGSGQVTATF